MCEFINANGWIFLEKKQIKFFQFNTFKKEKAKDKLIKYTTSTLFN